jgi:hypothetical protein
MNWEKIKALGGKIASAAPLLGSLLGPGGTATGTAIKLIASALGVEDTPEAIEAAITANPESLLKLKELELNHEVQLRQLSLDAARLQVERERAELADVGDARKREMTITAATGKRDVNLYILAWVIVIGFFALVTLLTQTTLPADSSGVTFMLFGSLATGFGQVLGYFFGSSKSSAEKTEILANRKQ